MRLPKAHGSESRHIERKRIEHFQSDLTPRLTVEYSVGNQIFLSNILPGEVVNIP
jgi:hypothetical protein